MSEAEAEVVERYGRTKDEIERYGFGEEAIEEMIADFVERGVKPDYEFEGWGGENETPARIRAWRLPGIDVEVFVIDVGSHYPYHASCYPGDYGDFSGLDAVRLFRDCSFCESSTDDPVLVAKILGADAIQDAKPDGNGPVILLGVTDYYGSGQSVNRQGEGDDPVYEYESYADAQAAIDALYDGDNRVELGHNECAYWHKIVPAQWTLRAE